MHVLLLFPGLLPLNLHAIYATDNPQKVDRDALAVSHFRSWIDWAKTRGWGIDFNPTCFGHQLTADGFTLSHRDPAIRAFWVEHCIASRKIGAAIGQELGSPCVTNVWIPDGYKDTPADRTAPRARLQESLEKVFTSPPTAPLGAANSFTLLRLPGLRPALFWSCE